MSFKNKIKKIQKRDGEIVYFDQSRITSAILRAGQAVEEFNHDVSQQISDKVVETLNKVYSGRKKPPRVEEIQDVIEIEIMKAGFTNTAKAYIIYRRERGKIRDAKKEILSGKTTKLPFSLNSIKVIAGRYLLRDLETGEVLESPEEMFQRVAKALAKVEKDYEASSEKVKKIEEDFYKVMSSLEFLPAGRTLANAGAPTPVVSNCIVLHIEDSMEGIFSTLKDASLLQQAGSGLGFPFHLLRPAGSVAKRTMGVASGPVPFLKVYDLAFGVIKQQGRHGANMAVMRIDHPDVLEFINCKEKEGDLKNFNISVALTDEFMKQAIENTKSPWMCQFGGKKMLPRRMIKDQFGNILEIKEVKITARDILEELSRASWLNGEPGIIFIDEVNRTNPLPGLGRIEACNPCGEQFLGDGDVCNLGSINLDKFVKDGKIDFERLEDVVGIATRMLDNVIDITKFPTERINKVFKKNRRIGLGIMGFADMLFQLNVPYNSEEGRQVAERVMKFITNKAHATSQELAKEKGVFPNYNKSIYKKKGLKMRNAALTTIAPTGTISMVADISSGVEPYFALTYVKKEVMGGQKLFYTNRHLEKRLEEEGIFTEKLNQKIVQLGSVQKIPEIPNQIKKVFVGSLDISVADHIKMQSIFQKHVDNSISKTINFPNQASVKDVFDGYVLAWKMKLKSLTVYRESSRKVEVLGLTSKEKKAPKSAILEMMGNNKPICPKCQAGLVFQEGCLSCPHCGFGVCSS